MAVVVRQVLVRGLFELGYVGAPAISALPVGDLIDQVPVDALLDAILTGDFSASPGADQLPPPPSDLEGVQAIVEGLIATLTDSGGEGLPTDDAIAAITSIVSGLPGGDQLDPAALQEALAGLDPQALATVLADSIAAAAEGIIADPQSAPTALENLLSGLGGLLGL